MAQISDGKYQPWHRLDMLKFKDDFEKEYKFKIDADYNHPYDVLLVFDSEQDLLYFKLKFL